MQGHRLEGDITMIMFGSLNEYAVLLCVVLLMLGLARLAYGGRPP